MMQQPQPQKEAPIALDLNAQTLKSNTSLLTRIRTYMASAIGIAAGILGFSGLTGFLFYIALFFICSVFLGAKCDFKAGKYFPSGFTVYGGGLGKDMILYLMVWTIFYNVVHVI